MNDTSDLVCQQCHAAVAGSVEAEKCPACGSALNSDRSIAASTRLTPRTVDHRGIILPARHAVGGIITPR